MNAKTRIQQDLLRVREFVTAAYNLAMAGDLHGADLAAREATEHLTEAIRIRADVVDGKLTGDEDV
jgi:hypothetical protein